MSNDDNQDREREARDRIGNFMKADERAEDKLAADEDLQTLRLAVGRLDQQMADNAEEEQVQRQRAAIILVRHPYKASMLGFVGWSSSAGKILRLYLLDIELGRSLAHRLKHFFEWRRVTLDPTKRVDPGHHERT